jgi:putative Mg2+ transporter-C (MgtC) family protein
VVEIRFDVKTREKADKDVQTIIDFLGQSRVDLPVTLFRLLLSFVLGAIIGIEREWHRQSAGLRTHTMIAIGSTLFTLVSIYIPQTFTHFQMGDPGRVAAQIVTGIGFLGGGAIFRLGANVRGLTTAASIWAVAGIGMAVGTGMYAAALIGEGVVLFVLFAMAPFERRLFPDINLRSMEIVLSGSDPRTEKITSILGESGIGITAIDVSQSFEKKSVKLRLSIRMPKDLDWRRLYQRMEQVKGIKTVNLDQKI